MKNIKYFPYGDTEIDYLKKKDKKLAEVIEQIGPIQREVEGDLFESVVRHIVGQQISTKAQRTVCGRLDDLLGNMSAESILDVGTEALQQCGMSFRKAEYITDFAQKIHAKEFDLDALYDLSDEEVIARLTTLRGIGVWTAEMLLLFSMLRPDVLSYGDLAIVRGLRMIYHHRNIDRKRFEVYRRRFSPYGSTASLYIWAVAGGAIEGMKDYAPKKKKAKTKTNIK